MKNILVIVDKGNVWEITGTTIQTDDYVVDPEAVYELKDGVGKLLFDYIKGRLNTAQIQFPKKLEGNLIKEDLIENEYSPQEYRRSKILQNGREYISTRLNIVSVFDIFDFTLANNKLASEGHFISTGNKREKYLEVIDTGSLELIDALETYLNSIDRLTVLHGWYKQYREFEKNIYEASSIEEMEEHYRIFVQIFE